MSGPVVSPFSAPGTGHATARRVDLHPPLSFDTLVQQWAPEINAMALGLSAPWCKAADLEQASLIALWHAAAHFRSNRGVLDHYVRRAIKRAMVRERERSRPLTLRRPEFVSLYEEHVADLVSKVGYEADPFGLTEIVAEWVRGLPHQLAQVFELLYRHGLTQAEAGVIMGVSQPRVAQLHAQLLARGKTELVALAA